MLRHSISQVFGAKHPALSARENDDIRPRFTQPYATNSYSIQRPDRVSGSANTNVPHLEPSLQPSQYQNPAAMPISTPAPAPAFQPLPLLGHAPQTPSTVSQVTIRDTSNLHPVFFTARLRKSPFILDAVAITSPVAYGYQEVHRRADGTILALL
ncbi:hypothetical protein M426DRAFT_202207 [Hypoxylon sp. CI-4A]|nr:hypothetical protein M426DRAFT_202207 [Hypoxylon sp. CI-4A]